jgi:uncharacterized integral membrane protein
MGQTGLIFSLVLAILVALFAVQNAGPVVLRFGPLSTETSLVVVILVAVAAGALVASLIGLPGWMRDRRRLRQLMRELDSLRLSRPQEPKLPTETPPNPLT